MITHDKTSINPQNGPETVHPEFRDEGLKLAERIGIAARELSLYAD